MRPASPLPMRPRGPNGLLAALLCAACGAFALPALAAETDSAPQPAAARRADGANRNFEQHVRPLLKAHCFHCHGDEEELAGKLDLRLVRTMRQGGESGPALVTGRHADSLLWQRISAGEMPPGEKKMSPAELAVVARWIDAGALTLRPEPESLSHDGLTDHDRQHWSFRPIVAPPVPQVQQQSQVRTPIDAFVLQRLEALAAEMEAEESASTGSATQPAAAPRFGLSPEADRETLIRRATVDLLGLPPAPEAVERFVHDSRPDAYERLIEELLESPHYGERWARHWLDAAGYADSNGYTVQDSPRKWAYKYRDYLIQALNADRPWNELLEEQLAGDEMLEPPYKNLSPAQADKLIATGFLRMGPDGTGDAPADPALARHEVVADTIKIFSTAVLGLTVGCAQCHTHRYDPITQVDYYRFRAIFDPAYDCQNWRLPAGRLISLWTDEQREKFQQAEAEVKRINADRAKAFADLTAQLREAQIAELPEEEKELVRQAAAADVAKRTKEQKALLVKYPKAAIPLGLLSRNAPQEYKEIDERHNKLIAEATKDRPVENFALCLTEVPGKVSPTRLLYRGDHNQPRQEVTPAELAVLRTAQAPELPADDPALPTTGRRLAYARQLTDGRHPLVARVLVNRLWLHHFGRGLVNTPADFGALGEKPTHPELLDWLADDFMRNGWQLKRFHQLLMTSAVYRQAARREAELDRLDPENRYLGRMSIRRLDAESLRDAILSASGQINLKLFGPPVPITPDETGQIIVGVDTRDGAGRPTGRKVSLNGEENRRSLYIEIRRSTPLGMLDTFDAATPTPNCTQRNNSTVTPQALLLLNNDFVIDQAHKFATRLEQEAGDQLPDQVALAWQLAFGRQPTAAQVAAAVDFLAQQQANFPPAADAKTSTKSATSTTAPPAASPMPAPPTPQHRALATWCQTLFSSNGFLYVD